MKKVSRVIIFCLIISMLCACGISKENKEESVSDLPTVTVGCDNYSPFSFMDANGNMTGIDVELAREAFSRMGYAPEFVFINWKIRRICWPKAVLTVSGAVSP